MAVDRVSSTSTTGVSRSADSLAGMPENVRRWAPLINEMAQKYGVPPRLIAAVIQQESGGINGRSSSVGAHGLMQLMPATARGLGVTNSSDPRQNIEGGTKYLASMLRQFNGNVSLALAAYNAGPGNVKKYGGIPPFAETRNYVSRITANYNGQGSVDTSGIPSVQSGPVNGVTVRDGQYARGPGAAENHASHVPTRGHSSFASFKSFLSSIFTGAPSDAVFQELINVNKDALERLRETSSLDARVVIDKVLRNEALNESEQALFLDTVGGLRLPGDERFPDRYFDHSPPQLELQPQPRGQPAPDGSPELADQVRGARGPVRP